jgi:hypothetical protein
MTVRKLNDYWKPTPVFWRKVGASINALGTAITGYAIFQDQGWAIASLLFTWIGTTITDFATDKELQ